LTGLARAPNIPAGQTDTGKIKRSWQSRGNEANDEVGTGEAGTGEAGTGEAGTGASSPAASGSPLIR
jgi:hypothetical protein